MLYFACPGSQYIDKGASCRGESRYFVNAAWALEGTDIPYQFFDRDNPPADPSKLIWHGYWDRNIPAGFKHYIINFWHIFQDQVPPGSIVTNQYNTPERRRQLDDLYPRNKVKLLPYCVPEFEISQMDERNLITRVYRDFLGIAEPEMIQLGHQIHSWIASALDRYKDLRYVMVTGAESLTHDQARERVFNRPSFAVLRPFESRITVYASVRWDELQTILSKTFIPIVAVPEDGNYSSTREELGIHGLPFVDQKSSPYELMSGRLFIDDWTKIDQMMEIYERLLTNRSYYRFYCNLYHEHAKASFSFDAYRIMLRNILKGLEC